MTGFSLFNEILRKQHILAEKNYSELWFLQRVTKQF